MVGRDFGIPRRIPAPNNARSNTPNDRAPNFEARCDRGSDVPGCVVGTFGHISGFAREIGNMIVNDVDVTAFVEGELDRRDPERVHLRAVRTADDHRAMWDTIAGLWSGDIGIHRSTELARSLIADQLVDELRLVMPPTIAGHGKRLFSVDTEMKLQQFDLIDLEKSAKGTLFLHYRRTGD